MGKPTPIFVWELNADGLSFKSLPAQAFSNTLAWEGAVVEAPYLMKHAGTYYLFSEPATAPSCR